MYVCTCTLLKGVGEAETPGLPKILIGTVDCSWKPIIKYQFVQAWAFDYRIRGANVHQGRFGGVAAGTDMPRRTRAKLSRKGEKKVGENPKGQLSGNEKQVEEDIYFL